MHYKVSILQAQNHIIDVRLTASRLSTDKSVIVNLPLWSAGSYLVRDYAQHVTDISACTTTGESLQCEKINKSAWRITWETIEENNCKFELHYHVYAHDLTVRTSHIDAHHAFLHAPSYLMTVTGQEHLAINLQLDMLNTWQHISTGLPKTDTPFHYHAENYEHLLDCPIEAGNQQIYHFNVESIPHELAFYGATYPHNHPIEKDIQHIVHYISTMMGGIPYKDYTFITHFFNDGFGGLEHKNSCALQFDGRKLADRKTYLRWLSLVAHEYFHVWNVKRIRPANFSQLDYQKEHYTTLLWLAEGLTSFMDDLLVLRSGLCSLEEYLHALTKAFKRYYKNTGRHHQSLEESSFDTWIKLYKPHENSNNAEISYYLKGALVFSALHIHLVEHGHSITNIIHELWALYQAHPEHGVSTEQVLNLVERYTDSNIRAQFYDYLHTTEEIDFAALYEKIGLQFEWATSNKASLGMDIKAKKGNNAFIEKIATGGSAYSGGLNAGDEIIAINQQRVYYNELKELHLLIQPLQSYDFLIARHGQLHTFTITAQTEPVTLKAIAIVDEQQALKALTA